MRLKIIKFELHLTQGVGFILNKITPNLFQNDQTFLCKY